METQTSYKYIIIYIYAVSYIYIYIYIYIYACNNEKKNTKKCSHVVVLFCQCYKYHQYH